MSGKTPGPIARMERVLRERCGFVRESYGEMGGTAHLLLISLEAAVPLRLQELRALEKQIGSEEFADHLETRARACADVIAEKGDVLQFRGKKKGETAAAFNALSEAVSIMAYCPGGVTFLGTRWEFKRERVPVE